MVNVQAGLDAVRQKDLDMEYDKACAEEKECNKIYKSDEASKTYTGLKVVPPKKRADEKA